MHKHPKLLIPTLIVMLIGAQASAAYIFEYFDYGGTSGNLAGFGSTENGWSGAWTGATQPNYGPSSNLSYSASGYSNTGNDAGTGASVAGSDNRGAIAYRNFDSGLTGTVWMSALLAVNASQGESILWLDTTSTGTGRDFLGLWDGDTPMLEYNSTSSTITDIGAIPTGTRLFLAKVVMNDGGTADTVSAWMDPDLSSGEAGLGTADFSGSGVDTFDATFDLMGISFGDGGVMDALRVSNEANAFDFVTTGVIPEPGTLSLLGVALLACLPILRKRWKIR